MYKPIFYALLSIAIGCKGQNNDHQNLTNQDADILKDMMESKYWPLDITIHIDSKNRSVATFKHYYEIGDCFGVTYNDSTFGLLLFDIVKTSEDVEYEFLLQDHIYKVAPSINEFKLHNFWGRKIPYETIKKNLIGFSKQSFSESFIEKNNKALIKIGHENISYKEDRFGSGGGGDQISDIARDFLFHTSSRNGEFNDDMLSTRDTSFSFNVLRLANSNEEIKQPQYVWILTKKEVHPNAKKLMQEDWWYSEGDDFSPFGNDDGSDALYGFKEWRDTHTAAEPSLYFNEIESDWNTSFEQKDWTDYKQIKTARNNSILYTGVDYTIIAVAFAQFVLEGKISPALIKYANKAIYRQILLTEKGDYDYSEKLKAERISTLRKQQKVIEEASRQQQLPGK